MKKELKKVTVWYSIQNGGDGSAHPAWFLTEEETEYDQENADEGWGETCNGSVETFEGSDIHERAKENSKEQQEGRDEEDGKLSHDDFYETRGVGTKARSDKQCFTCGKLIKMGTPHDMHHFYPEFVAYPTHKECTDEFMGNLK